MVLVSIVLVLISMFGGVCFIVVVIEWNGFGEFSGILMVVRLVLMRMLKMVLVFLGLMFCRIVISGCCIGGKGVFIVKDFFGLVRWW